MTIYLGSLKGTNHYYHVPVFYDDTDAGGIVYHANYLKIAERARTCCLRLLGLTHQSLNEHHKMVLVVRRCEVDFLHMAGLEDELEVKTGLEKIGRSSMILNQIISSQSHQVCFVRVVVVAVCIKTKKVKRFPQVVLEAFQNLWDLKQEVIH